MFELFYPDKVVNGIQDIDLEVLKALKIKGLVLDIDNTLVPPHVKEPDEKALKWIQRVKESGFKICLVSNATKKRVIKFNEKLKVYAIYRASKPASGAFRKAIGLMGIKPAETAVIGDQIFTDIWGGNKSGMYTILVAPIVNKEFFFVRLKRLPERWILRKL